jgi:Na+(H+)/acetate symporter ActP
VTGIIPLLFVIAITVATVALGMWATRQARTASDFFVAGRSVNVFWNASAISGEYLSAASFLGVAGLIMKHGYDALWYPVGYAFGYLFLLLFIAGPLRRFGAYTIPDFAEGRFDSPTFRRIAVIFVLCIGFFYTMPQMKGAGLTMGTIMGWPYWVGIVVVGSVITLNVALGGMKGITMVQAFQYWAKAFAIAAPVFVIMSLTGGYGKNLGEIADAPKEAPKFAKEETIKYPGKDKAPANVAALSTLGETLLTFPKGATIDKVGFARALRPDEMPPAVLFRGDRSAVTETTSLTIPEAGQLLGKPAAPNWKDNEPYEGALLTAPKLEFGTATDAVYRSGDYIPNAQNNQKWIEPYGTLTGKHGYPLLYTFSLIIALVCGTAGLPHILVRFYTNPDGRSAKRTTFWVMILLGVFYVFTPVWGTLGRADIPSLLANSKTDSLLIAMPRLMGGTLGEVLAGITSAGAFAAFMSTFSGLLVSMSGAFAHDVYGKILKPDATPEQRLNAFKIAAVVVGITSMGLGLLVETFDIALLVGWAFAIAAASYFPLLLLGSWWRGLTATGAATGMLLGGTLSLGAIIVFMLLDKKVLDLAVSPLVKGLLEQPAIWGVPFSLALMVLISLATKNQIPRDINTKMLRLHAPEELGLSKNYIDH